jgi:peptidoglycan/LPS O-acetylase OafA/YrhL
MSSQRRLAGVDGLRGLAAVGVVLLHVWMFTEQDAPGTPVLLEGVVGELRQGLTYFFVLSGFLLARPWMRAALGGSAPPMLGRYLRHRAARVLPAYWFALIGAFLILRGTGHDREVGVEALPAFALFAQNQIEPLLGQLNPPTWSLCVEIGFYLLLPLLGGAAVAAGRRHGRPGVLLVCAAMAAVGLSWSLAGALLHWPGTAVTSTPTFLPLFAAGIAAAALAHDRRPGGRTAVALVAGGAALILLNGLWHFPGTGVLGHTLRDLPAGIGFAGIIVAIVHRPGTVLDTPPIRMLGTISYGTYLWHMPVIYWLRVRDAVPEEFLRAFVTVLVPTLALGAISWVLVERPVLRWAARRDRRRRARAVEPVPDSPHPLRARGAAWPRETAARSGRAA